MAQKIDVEQSWAAVFNSLDNGWGISPGFYLLERPVPFGVEKAYLYSGSKAGNFLRIGPIRTVDCRYTALTPHS